MAHSRRSSVPNVSPLSRTSPLPPLTSIVPAPSPQLASAPPPPYTAPLPPPIRSRSVPHLHRLSSSSTIPQHSPSSTDSTQLSPELQAWSPDYLADRAHAETSSRRPPRPQRSRTSSSTSLGLVFGGTRGGRPPSFEESVALHTNGVGLALGRTYDSDDDALEIQSSARAARRRQASENSVLSQRRTGSVNVNGDGRISRTRSAEGPTPTPTVCPS